MGALQAYVGRVHPECSWSVSSTALPDGGVAFEVALVSQRWQGGLWSHRLWCVDPGPGTRRGPALLHITGSGDRDRDMARLHVLAARLERPCALLADVPNQPLLGELREDDLIAATFDRHLRTGDETLPLLLPMTAAAARALDVLEDLAARAGRAAPDGFVVTGASKRGWTTWLLAASDPRVRAIAPAVYDNLNIPAQIRRQRQVWAGGSSPQLESYARLGLTEQLEAEAGAALVRLVDPHAHRARLRLPKWLLLGTNDPYWPVDALSLYAADLPGPTYVTYVPNAGHWLDGGEERILAALQASVEIAAGGAPAPDPLRWSCLRTPAGCRVEATAPASGLGARLWQAESAGPVFDDARWSARPLPGPGPAFAAEIRPSADRHRAFFLEVEGRAWPGRGPVFLDTPVWGLAPAGS